MDHGSVLAREALLAACFHLNSGKNPPNNQMGNDPFDDIGHLLCGLYIILSHQERCHPNVILLVHCFIDDGQRSIR